MEFALIFFTICYNKFSKEEITKINGKEKTPDDIKKLLESNDLENFMGIFNEYYYNKDFRNLGDSILEKIKSKIYSIWNLNPLNPLHLEKLGIFFLIYINILSTTRSNSFFYN